MGRVHGCVALHEEKRNALPSVWLTLLCAGALSALNRPPASTAVLNVLPDAATKTFVQRRAGHSKPRLQIAATGTCGAAC